MCTVDYTTMCMGAHLQCAYAQLSPPYLFSILYVYPTLLITDKLFQAIYCISILQVTESWAGPWNKVLQTHYHKVFYYTT